MGGRLCGYGEGDYMDMEKFDEEGWLDYYVTWVTLWEDP